MTGSELNTKFPNLNGKELIFSEASQVMQMLRERGKSIVQCHGTFDLVHPGHIIHFEEAKKLGDLLVVTLTQGEYVNKGPGRPLFDDATRVKHLAALEIVDYVVLVPFPAAVEAIECIQPHHYCKGTEYHDPNNDVTGKIGEDVDAVKRFWRASAFCRLCGAQFDETDQQSVRCSSKRNKGNLSGYIEKHNARKIQRGSRSIFLH
jgi:cytidyltransferase-like protein